jgi:hypothetical protein
VYLVWNAAEAMENVVSSKEFGVSGRVRETIESEDGGSHSSHKQLKKHKMLMVVGPRTPHALMSLVLAGR